MSDTSFKFDPELCEYNADFEVYNYATYETDLYTVDIYKLGGGTLGQRYEEFWAYQVSKLNEWTGKFVTCISGDDLWTGTPKTHGEAAFIVLECYLEHHDAYIENPSNEEAANQQMYDTCIHPRGEF